MTATEWIAEWLATETNPARAADDQALIKRLRDDMRMSDEDIKDFIVSFT